MAKNRLVDTIFWEDNYTANLDPIEKLMFLYFLTNSSTSICGAYQITIKKIAVETGIDKDMVEKVLARFEKDGKVFYREGWIGIKNFIKHQNQRSPKIKKGIELYLEEVPENIKTLILNKTEGIDTLSHSNSNSNSNLNTNSKSNINILPKGRAETAITDKKEFGDPQINASISFLKEKLGGSPDGSIAINRRFCKFLLDKLRKDYPNKDPVELVKALISGGIQDAFHGKNITNFRYLYYNCQKIIYTIKEASKSEIINRELTANLSTKPN